MDYHPDRKNKPVPFRGVPWKLVLRDFVTFMERNLDVYNQNSASSQKARTAVANILAHAENFSSHFAKIITLHDEMKNLSAQGDNLLLLRRAQSANDLIVKSIKEHAEEKNQDRRAEIIRYNIVQICQSMMAEEIEKIKLHPILTTRLNSLLKISDFPEKIGAHYGEGQESQPRFLLPAQTGGPYPDMTAGGAATTIEEKSHWKHSIQSSLQLMRTNLQAYYLGADTATLALKAGIVITDTVERFEHYRYADPLMSKLTEQRQALETALAAAEAAYDPSVKDHCLAGVYRAADQLAKTFRQISIPDDLEIRGKSAFSSPEAYQALSDAVDEDIESERTADAFRKAAQPDGSMSKIKSWGVFLAVAFTAAVGWFVSESVKQKPEASAGLSQLPTSAAADGTTHSIRPPSLDDR